MKKPVVLDIDYVRRTIRETVEKFLTPLIRAGRAERTIEGYRDSLYRDLWFLYENGEDIHPSKISVDGIELLISDQWKGAPKYNHNRRSIFFRYLDYHDNALSKEYPSPRNSTQRVTIGPDKWLDNHEAVAFYLACETPVEKWLGHGLMKLMMRGHDLRNVTVDDIYMGYIEVLGKGGRREPVSFMGDTAAVLTELFEYRNEVISGIANPPRDLLVYRAGPKFRPRVGVYQKTAIDDMVRELGERAGIDRKVTKHMLRRTGARMCLRSGASEEEVSRALRHASVETTRIYLGLTVDDLKPVAMRFDDYFNQRKEEFQKGGFRTQTETIARSEKWTGRDLNSRPLPCQGSDLPTDLPARVCCE